MKNTIFSSQAILIALSIALFLQSACKKDPVEASPEASFEVSKTTGTVKDIFVFTNTSINADAYHWDFGDGNTSSEEHPQHQFKQAGTFTVKLTATRKEQSSSAINTVTISAINPVANFTELGNICSAPATLQFTNTSTDLSSFEWDFGDGSSSTEINPEHTFSSPGNYTVTLTGMGEFGMATKTKIISVSEASVFAGLSVDGVKLDDSFGSIKAKYAGYLYTDVWAIITPGIYLHAVIYSDLGLAFGFLSQYQNLSNSATTFAIIVNAPFKGKTDRCIGIGGSFADVLAQYGDAEKKDTDWWEYPSLGIDFEFENIPDVVTSMMVYEKDGLQNDLPIEQFGRIVTESR